MNYQKIYDSLIKRGRNRILKSYSENHHIIPKCLGGSNDKENLVGLTAEEHYVVHQLLVKIYPGNRSLIFAAHRMGCSKNEKTKRNNKWYGWLREKHADSISGESNPMFGMIGEKSPNFGKKDSDERKKQRSILTSGKNNGMYGKTGKDNPNFGKFGKDNPNFGKKHSKESKQKMSKAKRGKKRPPFSIEWKENISKSRKRQEMIKFMGEKYVK